MRKVTEKVEGSGEAARKSAAESDRLIRVLACESP
jgi:hypothetical protein